jgi:recombination DNA repair RAD52 pathway protein
MSVKIKSYLPPEKRERSKLQQVKDKHRSFTLTNKNGIPKDLNELKEMKYREHGITFLNQYMNINKKTSKSQYCKTNHISHNSLNTGLNLLGYKTRVKETNLDKTRPVETNLDQSRPVKTSKSKSKPSEIKGGNTYEDEEIKEMINNSLVNLSTS